MLEGQTGTPADIPAAAGRLSNNKVRLLMVGAALVLALGYLIYTAFPGNAQYYLTVDEFLAQDSAQGRQERAGCGEAGPRHLSRGWMAAPRPPLQSTTMEQRCTPPTTASCRTYSSIPTRI